MNFDQGKLCQLLVVMLNEFLPVKCGDFIDLFGRMTTLHLPAAVSGNFLDEQQLWIARFTWQQTFGSNGRAIRTTFGHVTRAPG